MTYVLPKLSAQVSGVKKSRFPIKTLENWPMLSKPWIAAGQSSPNAYLLLVLVDDLVVCLDDVLFGLAACTSARFAAARSPTIRTC